MGLSYSPKHFNISDHTVPPETDYSVCLTGRKSKHRGVQDLRNRRQQKGAYLSRVVSAFSVP